MSDTPAASAAPAGTGKAAAAPQRFKFSADIAQLMRLIIYTFYSNAGIFLRELISNSSDALDKIRFQSLKDPKALAADPDMKIEIIPDKKNNRLIIQDTGIGMTKNDLVKNLGTIARSGTKKFLEALEAGADITMIGQFGVGFYSAYLVADRVTVISKNNMDEAHVWESSAGKSFTIRPVTPEDPQIKRGTAIILHLKKEHTKFLETKEITDLVKKHSQFIAHPILLAVEEEKEVEVDAEEETKEESKDSTDADKDKDKEDGPSVEDAEDDEKKAKKTTKKMVTTWQKLNEQAPIWLRKPDDVKREEYVDFYKTLSGEWKEHLDQQLIDIEGGISCTALIFVPGAAPYDMFEAKKKNNKIKLYVRRVFIMDDSTELVPEWLNFIHGVVDSDDMPLNVSREALQRARILGVIKKQLTKRSIDMFARIAEDEKKYKTFWENFGKNIKLGIHEDADNRKRLVKLLRYNSTKSGKDFTSLSEYVSRMKPDQKSIYYITGDSLDTVKSSPFIEAVKAKGHEVLFMVDPLDEYVVQQVRDFEDKKLVCLSKEGLELEKTDAEKKTFEEQKTSHTAFLEKVKEVLGDKIEKAVLSDRLKSSPCVLVTGQFGWTANMERIMKAQALRNPAMSSMLISKKTLELNPSHPIVAEMKKRFDASADDDGVQDLLWMLYEASLLTSGFQITEPTKFARRVHKLIALGLEIEDDEEADASADASETAVEGDDAVPDLDDITDDLLTSVD